jgi:cyclase
LLVYLAAIMTCHTRRYTSAPPWLLALALVIGCGVWTHGLGAQQRQAAAAAPAIETLQIRPNVHVIFGAGSNITAHVGEDGVILVDSGSAALAPRVVEAVKALSPLPIRLIINTSADMDHVGGNHVVGAAGVQLNPDSFADEPQATILAHENVLMRMTTPVGNEAPAESDMLPTETYTSRVRSMYINDEAVQLLRPLGAHSDGDTMVHFRRADVIATGDVLDLRQFPVIDAARGGSLAGELAALNRLVQLAIPAMPLVYKEGRTMVVPGHGRVSDHAEIVEYRDMVTVIRDRIQSLVSKGMTLEQVQAANPTQGYRARYGADAGAWTTGMFVEAIYRALAGARPS